ncbi:MAG: phage portal protein [Candidatus Omnitrophica bacterium]|nr:phage portal protein [Candidatus Omnitrophota bacterium]MDD5592657.1 phage portal protein [Candidatus Omnitrophota bacterium]
MINKREPKQSFGEKFSEGIDNIVGAFSPFIAAKRRWFRFISKSMFNSYRGAEGGRLRGSWIPGGGSADEDLLADLSKLREKSRDLVRNDGIASGAINTIITNIIGTGIKPQSRLDMETLKINEEYADQLQRQIEKIWGRWVPIADAGKRSNYYELEELSERQRFVNGESIIIPLRITNKNRLYSLALQTVESDRLDTPSDLVSNKDIRKGIEIGEYGEPVAYWIRKIHPGDYTYGRYTGNNMRSNYNRYPAERSDGTKNFFHLYHLLRSGQTRGEPFMAPVINLFKDRFDYMEAELVAARVAACFAVFIKKENASEFAVGRSTEDSITEKRQEELSPGLLEYLEPGEDISAFNPQRPGGSFAPFMVRILRDIASGLNIPYEVLSKDFSQSNYSNLRGALLEARRFFMMQQKFVADKFGQPCLELLIEEAYLKGELPILDFYTNRESYIKTRWICPGWQWVDPKNEIESSIKAVDNGLSTLAEEVASQGYDWEEVLVQRAREKKKIKELEEKYGIDMTPSQSSQPGNKETDPEPEKVPPEVPTNGQEE